MCRHLLYIVFALFFVMVIAALAEPPDDYQQNWPQWRGPAGTGVAFYGNPPVEWGEDTNIKWKIALPGKGQATPVIWDDQIFLLTAIETDRDGEIKNFESQQRSGGWRPPVNSSSKIFKFDILAVNRTDGKVLWQRTACEERPHQDTHATASWASNSPVTDGNHVYAYFGSRGLYCYDLEGHLKWKKDFGNMDKKLSFGEGSSPVLHKDKLFIIWDHEGQSLIVAVNKSTGDVVWQKERDEVTSWSSPLVVNSNGVDQVITSASSRIRSYDAGTGKLIWESSGMTGNVIPTPVAADDIVYLMSGFRGSALQAIRISSAKGNVVDSDAMVWQLDKDTPYTPSALLYDGMLYFLKSNKGILSCYDAKTGAKIYGRIRLQGMTNVYASPTAVADRIYIVDLSGNGVVVRHGSEFELLATNKLDDSFGASPVIKGDDLFLRGEDNLYCISE